MEFSEFISHGREQGRQLRPAVSYSGSYIATVSLVANTVPHPPASLSRLNNSVNDKDSMPVNFQYKLAIRSIPSLALKRLLLMPVGFTPRFLKWYRPAAAGLPDNNTESESQLDDYIHRIFAADDTGQVCVWDIDGILDRVVTNEIEDLKSVVTIRQLDWGDNVSIKNVCWGRSPDEIMIFSDFGVAVALWSLKTHQCVQLYHPKYTDSHGYSFQPGTRHLTVLSHPVTDDVLTVYGGLLSNLQTLSSVTLTDFYHAKGFKWSPDGRWIAVYDTNTNYQVGIYTPLGALYRVFIMTDIGLGVNSIGWSPAGNLLAVASYDGLIRCLNTWTFTPVSNL